MEEELLNSLRNLGYSGSIKEKDSLDSALHEGPKNIEYTKLVNYLTNELRILLNIDEAVNAILHPEDSLSFLMETSSFLKELNCPYLDLTQGHISERLQSLEDKLLLLDYLSSELMAARILQDKKPNKTLELKLHETERAASMRKILMTLRFPRPPANISMQQLFQKVCPTVETVLRKTGTDLISKSAIKVALSDKQWETLGNIQSDIHQDYQIRREMLLTRLDVTIQSFQWSDTTKDKDELFDKIYAEKRKRLKIDPAVCLADLLAARDTIAIIEKTSCSSVRKNTQSSLNKVIIGQVPDRGGRTSEQAPPPPEMPSWQQRSSLGGGGGRGGGVGRGGRGGGFGGNYQRSDNSQQHYSRDNQKYGGGQFSSQSDNYNTSTKSYDNFGAKNNFNSYQNFDSAGSYNSNYSTSSNRDFNTRGQGNSNSGAYDNRGSDGGNYSRKDFYEQNSKRPKTYDSFQSNRTSYSDQYVQEEQHNQQYGRGGNHGRGRGQSNYNRGGRNRY